MGGGKVELILTKRKSDNEVIVLSKFHDRVVDISRTNTDVPTEILV
jgi:hypothetical protein